MSKLPWMPFLGFDYETDRRCKLLRPEEHGTYLLLLWEQWKEGSVPADPEETVELLPGRGHSVELVTKMLDQFFIPNGKDGHLINEKLDELRARKMAEHAGRRLGGKKTARINKKKAKDLRAEHSTEQDTGAGSSGGGNKNQNQRGDIETEKKQPTAIVPAGAGSAGEDLFGKSSAMEEVNSKAQQAGKNKEALNAAARFVFTYSLNRWRKTFRTIDEKRLKRIRARLKESRGDVSELLYAADGATKMSHLVDGGYLQVSTVFRDREQVEKLAEKAGFKPGMIHPTHKQLMEEQGE